MIIGSGICTHRPSLSFFVNEISRNKVVVPEGAAGLKYFQIISISWVFIYAELLCRAIRHDLILLIILFYLFVFYWIFFEESFWLLYIFDLIFITIVYLYREGSICFNVFLEVDFVCRTLCIRVHWILLFIFISRFKRS